MIGATFKPSLIAIAVAAVSGLAASPAMADWTGKGQAGAVIASGNTESKAGNVKLSLTDAYDAWKHDFGFDAVYASDATGTTAQRFQIAEQSNYKFDAHNFVYGGLRYEQDHFSGFKDQAIVSAGVGHQFIDTDATKLSGQVGLGYKRSETRTPSTTTSALAYLGAVDFKHAFNASTSIFDKLTVEATSGNTFAENDIGVEVKMSDRLALAVGYAVRNNTDPPPAFKKTDTLTTLNIVYQFK